MLNPSLVTLLFCTYYFCLYSQFSPLTQSTYHYITTLALMIFRNLLLFIGVLFINTWRSQILSLMSTCHLIQFQTSMWSYKYYFCNVLQTNYGYQLRWFDFFNASVRLNHGKLEMLKLMSSKASDCSWWLTWGLVVSSASIHSKLSQAAKTRSRRLRTARAESVATSGFRRCNTAASWICPASSCSSSVAVSISTSHATAKRSTTMRYDTSTCR